MHEGKQGADPFKSAADKRKIKPGAAKERCYVHENGINRRGLFIREKHAEKQPKGDVKRRCGQQNQHGEQDVPAWRKAEAECRQEAHGALCSTDGEHRQRIAENVFARQCGRCEHAQ